MTIESRAKVMHGVRPAQLPQIADWRLNGEISFDDLMTHLPSTTTSPRCARAIQFVA